MSRSPKYARARLRADLAASLDAARDRRRDQRRRAVAEVPGAGVDRALAAGAVRWAALEADARAAGIALGVYAIVPDVLADARDRLDGGTRAAPRPFSACSPPASTRPSGTSTPLSTGSRSAGP